MIRKVARNTFFLSASQIVARTIGLFYFIFLARRLGVETFGVYNFTLAFIYNFVPVADFGIERLVLRDIARQPDKSQFYFSRLLSLKFLLAVGALVVAIVLGMVLGQSRQQIFYFSIFGIALIPQSLIYLITSLQNAREKMEYMAVANIGIISLTAFIGASFFQLGLSLSWVLFAYFLANLVVCGVFFFKLTSWNLKLEWVIDKKFWRQALSQSWVFGVILILAVFYLRISLVLIGILKDSYSTGIYGSVFKFVEAGILIPQSLALALFPLSSKLLVSDKKRLVEIYKKGLVILFFGGLGVCLVMFFGAKFIIPLVYGEEYLQAIPIFSILGLAMVLFFVNALPGNIIHNSPQVKRFLPWAFLNFLVAVGLCLFLIPRYSIIGAAWAVVGGELFGLVINNLYVYKILNEKN